MMGMASEITAEHLAAMRHTAAHVLAAASRQLRPDTKLGVGPAVADGFYHDIDVAEHYTEADLSRLQKEMEQLKKKNLPIQQREVSKEDARQLFADDPYKLELLEEIPGETVGISDMGEGFFVTLCKGGHVASTGEIGHFKLTRLGGVYWKSDETRSQLQRIYGILFATAAELAEYETNRKEAQKRDHRKLGKALDLFAFSPLIGPGLPLFTPRGTIIRQELENFLQSLQEPLGYQRVVIPHITKAELYKTSGHWEKFQDNLFHVKGAGSDQFVMKPMNCPHHTQLYASRPRSYRELPLRFSEVTAVYRDEQAGELAGLTRVRAITQDDAHVFAREDQIEEEATRALNIIDGFYQAFDFNLKPRLSLRDPNQAEKYLGGDAMWERAEATLRTILQRRGAAFTEITGEAAFYGPKIDYMGYDSLGRQWQLATVQLDFNQPIRFDLTYTDETGQAKTPVMIHRAILGSFERFMAILIEHYAGNFPLWLSPTQVAVLPIGEEQAAYAAIIAEQLRAQNIRAEVDESSVSIGKKIREGQVKKVPYLLIVGKKEAAEQAVAVRSREKGDEGMASVNDVQDRLLKEIQDKR